MGRPKVSAEVRSRIVQIRASDPVRPPTIDTILDRLAEEEIEVSRSYVGGVVNKWESMPLEMRQRDMPFEWRQLERARVPWEASRWLMDCQRTYDLAFSDPNLQRLYRETVMGDPDASHSSFTDEPCGGDVVPLHSFEPFTNRWACWCWRVHLAVPDLDHAVLPNWLERILGRFSGYHLFTLDVSRIYSAQEQLSDLVPGTPRMDLGWLDLFLRHVGRPRPLGWYNSGLFPDILLSRGSREAIEVASLADKLDPASALGLKRAYLKIFFIFSRWKGELQKEADILWQLRGESG